MNRLNRREFLGVFGGATAIALASPALASTTADKAAFSLTSLYVKGLVMVDLGDPEIIRLGFPKAPGHKATLSVIPQNGEKQVMPLKGKGAIEVSATESTEAKIFVPELVRMKEFYGNDVQGHIDRCPGLISIPRKAIHAITT